jgi:putative transposase
LIGKQWKNELEKYITGVIQNHKHKLLAINAMPDHIHIFIGYNLNHLIPNLVEEIKTSSNSWIKQNGFSKFKFEWQRGYGAFTNSHSQIGKVIKYIMNQEVHHKKKSFKEEYLEMLQKNEIKYSDETTMNKIYSHRSTIIIFMGVPSKCEAFYRIPLK